MQPLEDWRGRTDATGLELQRHLAGVADAAAAAADLARAKDSREPVVHHRGPRALRHAEDGPGAAALLRPLEEDLFSLDRLRGAAQLPRAETAARLPPPRSGSSWNGQ